MWRRTFQKREPTEQLGVFTEHPGIPRVQMLRAKGKVTGGSRGDGESQKVKSCEL
jgi:hypothetical protein